MKNTLPLRIAHRGNTRDFLENTVEAFTSALHLGADGIELDVHLDRSGTLVVVHDYLFEKNKSYPTLDEVLVRFGNRTRLEIELKSLEIQAITTLHEMITTYSPKDIEITSSIQPLLPQVRKVFPHTPLGLLFRRFLIEDWMTTEFRSYWILHHLKLCGATVLHLDLDMYTQELVDAIHEAGCKTHTHLLTANESEWDKIRTLGIDQCTFDDPDVLQFT